MRVSPTAAVGLRMRSRTPGSGGDVLHDAQKFSLVLGGPLFQLLYKVHLSDDAMLHLRQRVIVISLFAWLPLFVLSALHGDLIGRHVAVPFLLDLEVHIRFLVAVPLLIVAELVVHRRLHRVALAFLDRNLIPQAAMSRFHEALNAAYRLRNSVVAELVLIVLVYVVGIQVWRHLTALDAATWYVTSSAAGSKLLPAGIWCEIAVMVIFLLCVVFGPLLVFTPQLARAEREGLYAYGSLAEQYVREFDSKWVHGSSPRSEPLVGSADIQSLADLDASHEIVRTMRWAPISRQAVLELAAAVLVPIAPLLLTVMPLEALFNKLLGVLF